MTPKVLQKPRPDEKEVVDLRVEVAAAAEGRRVRIEQAEAIAEGERAQANAEFMKVVRRVRDKRLGWKDIADAGGISRQAIHEMARRS